MNKLTMRC